MDINHCEVGNIAMSRLRFSTKLIIVFILVMLCSGCFLWREIVDVGDGVDDGTNETGIDITQFGVRSNVVECQAKAINAAIAEVSKHPGGGILYFPAGKYYIGPDAQILLAPKVDLRGAGTGKTVIWGDNGGRYLVGSRSGELKVAVCQLTLENPERLILLQHISDIEFFETEFLKGMVRFENSARILIDHCCFADNAGKAAYASDACTDVRLTNNEVINPKEGGFNLSRHQNSYVADNFIYSETNIQSGYAGIRLPNSAQNNVVVNNEIIRMGRGIFVLSSSEYNLVENNRIDRSTSQGIFVESSHNLIRNNIIQDAGAEAVYVADSSSATPSKAHYNLIEGNRIFDTYTNPNIEHKRNVGLKIYGQGNEVCSNTVNGAYGRRFKEISSGNVDSGNIYIGK